jgi:hypothetical protein
LVQLTRLSNDDTVLLNFNTVESLMDFRLYAMPNSQDKPVLYYVGWSLVNPCTRIRNYELSHVAGKLITVSKIMLKYALLQADG